MQGFQQIFGQLRALQHHPHEDQQRHGDELKIFREQPDSRHKNKELGEGKNIERDAQGPVSDGEPAQHQANWITGKHQRHQAEEHQ